MSIFKIIRQLVVKPWQQGTLISSFFQYPKFFSQLNKYKSRSSENIPWNSINPQFEDATKETPFDAHYFYQSAWCARKIAFHNPKHHVDVASQINLIAPLSAFVEVEFIDFRPLNVNLNNLTSRAGTIINLPFKDKSVDSLSCLHVIEHIGLGRYGDDIDPNGNKTACKELQRVLSVGGDLYLSTPIGKERVEFNAHRVHSYKTILQFCNELQLVSFSYVDDGGTYVENSSPEISETFNYGVGLFHFRRVQ
jgi:hypothetical protein